MPPPRYVELQVTSHISFLRGASSCQELFAAAMVLGIEALAIVDRNSAAGIVRAHVAAKETGVRLIIGCRLDLADGTGILVYPTDRPAYSRLCRLLSIGKRRVGKGKCNLTWEDLPDHAEGLITVLVPDEADEDCAQRLRRTKAIFTAGAYLALSLRRRPGDELCLHILSNLAFHAGVPTVATNDVLFHTPERRLLQDVVTCVRNKCTIDELGFRHERHADRHLKPAEEMHRLFSHYPEALARTLEIAERCCFSLDELGFYAPAQIVGDAKAHGVEVRRVCINASRWDSTLEPIGETGAFAVRLGFREVKHLSNIDGAKIVTARGDEPFLSIDDVWRRAGAPVASLVKIAEADGFRPSLKLSRRDAAWAIKALRDEPLPLFAAASARQRVIVPEVDEPEVPLKPMTAGREVVEDYGHVGLTLREHPVSLLRRELGTQRYIPCRTAGQARDGKALKTAGFFLIRQMPGSAKGVMFITVEDETGVANLVIWPKLYEKQRRIILTASMLGIDGRIQREGEMVHLIAYHLTDLSPALASIGDRDTPFPLPHGRGDEFARGPHAPDPRDGPPRGPRPRDIFIPDLHIDTIKQKARNFR